MFGAQCRSSKGTFFIWLNAAAVTLSMLGVLGILLMLAWNGLGHFWPAKIVQIKYQNGEQLVSFIGEWRRSESVDREFLLQQGVEVPAEGGNHFVRRLLKIGNRDVFGRDFIWLWQHKEYKERSVQQLRDLVVVERSEWGDVYGRIRALQLGDVRHTAHENDTFWKTLRETLAHSTKLRKEIRTEEKKALSDLNYRLEKLRLRERKLQLEGLDKQQQQIEKIAITSTRPYLYIIYEQLRTDLEPLLARLESDSLELELANGETLRIPFSHVLHILRPNDMGMLQKISVYARRMWAFLSTEPREANTEGGVFPAIFGTLTMVLLMTVFVTPLGVITAIYLHEYTRQGILTRLVRISVNNLAGVPSIVYGIFGLGFFVYVLGGNIDQLFYRAGLPSPTFGTPGLLWASLTLAILTLPVVIVTTEEGLSRIPRNIREGGLALGATKAETLQSIILPMASPAIMTGLILAVARAAGEVAPLMLVGVVKVAPALPVDGDFPFLHLERKFMHLGFHIYDIGFQSPNVEAGRPLLYATALLLVALIAGLNLAAVVLRNRLREKYRNLEGGL